METEFYDCKRLDFPRFQLELKDLLLLENIQRFGGEARTSWRKVHLNSEAHQREHNT